MNSSPSPACSSIKPFHESNYIRTCATKVKSIFKIFFVWILLYHTINNVHSVVKYTKMLLNFLKKTKLLKTLREFPQINCEWTINIYVVGYTDNFKLNILKYHITSLDVRNVEKWLSLTTIKAMIGFITNMPYWSFITRNTYHQKICHHLLIIEAYL